MHISIVKDEIYYINIWTKPDYKLESILGHIRFIVPRAKLVSETGYQLVVRISGNYTHIFELLNYVSIELHDSL